jgi:hypothetical protein
MTQADSVHSTPRTDSSLNRPMDSPKPVKRLSRRILLAGLAAVGIPTSTSVAVATATRDPIFAVIERHRELSAQYGAAVHISGDMTSDDPGFEAAELATQERCDALLDYSADELISLLPTTLAGTVALLRYVAGLKEWQQPADFVAWETSNGLTMDWYQVFLHTLADGVEALAGKEVRS